MLLLVLLPLAAAGLAFAMPSNRQRPWVLPVAGFAHLVVAAGVLSQGEQWALDRWLAVDPLSRLFTGFVSVLFFLCSLYAPAYLRVRTKRDNRVLCGCLLLALAMMSLVTLSHHLGLMWVAMEATTLATAPCIYFNRNPRSLEATWKYLLIGSVGIALALLGSFFLAYSMLEAGSESTLLVDELVKQSHKLSPSWLHAAFVLLLIGYGAKMGLAPMHTWKPDAYGEAPGLVGALLAGGLTSCAFLCVLRFYHLAHIAHDDEYLHRMLIFMGLLSMGTAALFMSNQRNIKRLLAYSSVEHMGMLVFGMGIGGPAAAGSLLHVVHNGLCKAALFLAAANIHRAYGSRTTDQVRGVLTRLPWSGWLMLISFFAVTGSPLFGPFVSEYQMLYGAFTTGHAVSGALFLVFLLFVFWGMGHTLIRCSLGRAELDEPAAGSHEFRDNLPMVFPIVVCVLLVFLLGVYTPQFLSTGVAEALQFLQRIPED
ncbi:MAG: proton-conducting transporter membrane subunit [Planctomycetaceae bacterium]